MKKKILIISIVFLGFSFSSYSQNKADEPVLSNGSKVKIDNNNTKTATKEVPKLGTASKIKASSKTKNKSNKASEAPILGTMNKKKKD